MRSWRPPAASTASRSSLPPGTPVITIARPTGGRRATRGLLPATDEPDADVTRRVLTACRAGPFGPAGSVSSWTHAICPRAPVRADVERLLSDDDGAEGERRRQR